MRLLCCILSLYIMSIALIPCDCDEVFRHGGDECAGAVLDYPEEECPPIDHCTPFCSCSYCAHFFFARYEMVCVQPAEVYTVPVVCCCVEREVTTSRIPLLNPPELS